MRVSALVGKTRAHASMSVGRGRGKSPAAARVAAKGAIQGYRLDGAAARANCYKMFVTFFQELKAAGVPVTLREYLTLMDAMQVDLASRRVEAFSYLSRTALVKDERNLDKFDRVFATCFKR